MPSGLAERLPKQVYDAMRRYDEAIKLSKAGLARTRTFTPKHYLAGNAYLHWKDTILKPNGDRYEAAFVARRLERVTDNASLAIFKSDINARRIFDGKNDLMLVGDIKAMDAKQRPVSSLVGLCLTSQTGGNIPCAWTDNLLPDFGFELCEIANDGEICALSAPAISDSAGGNEMIQCRSEVVDGVTRDQRQFVGQSPSASNDKAMTLRHWIDLQDGEVRIATEISRGCSVKISNVGFCPVKL